jgi:hypothetical protein
LSRHHALMHIYPIFNLACVAVKMPMLDKAVYFALRPRSLKLLIEWYVCEFPPA